MKAFVLVLVSLLFILILWFLPAQQKMIIAVEDEQAALIAEKIWMNEGAGKRENLVVWNEGEAFPSLGIGHFIWYPKGVPHTFKESFPDLLKFIGQFRSLPDVLRGRSFPPWDSRESFLEKRNSAVTHEIVDFLEQTKTEQAKFIIARMEAALPKIVASLADEKSREHVRQQFYSVAAHENGLYALIDYTNFKGEGVSEKEQYDGEGWGLTQVLLSMQNGETPVMQDFVRAADFVLTRRVENAPRDESRWLPGWRKRLQTYLEN